MDYPDYNPQLDNQPLTDEELAEFDKTLQALSGPQADSAMNIEGMDGYLTALLVGPPVLERLKSADWLPAIWAGDGADGAPFTSGRQRKRATVMVLRHLHSIAVQLRDKPELWEPVFSVADTDDSELVDAEDWCIGFLQAVSLDAGAWEPLFDDADIGAALVPIALLGGDESQLDPADEARLADPVQRDALSRAVMDGVLMLYRQRHPAA